MILQPGIKPRHLMLFSNWNVQIQATTIKRMATSRVSSQSHDTPHQSSRSQTLRNTIPRLHDEKWAGYNVLILLVSLIAIGMLTIGVVVELTPSARSLLAYADLIVCIVFLADFIVSLIRAPNRWHYFVTWGWVDLLSSIPVSDSMRWGRAARVVRVLSLIHI